jgi:hypothetical protein
MANQADVRVRLSAEGQAEVIAAFQKIASEGKKAGHEAGEGMKELNKQLLEVGKVLSGGIGIVLVAEKFKEFFKSTLEGAENMTRLSKQTGISTDAIQGMGRAARETGVSQEIVNNGLVKFTAAVGKAEIGSKQSTTALSDLGIAVKDFQKLTPDQQLQLVAKRLSDIADPARRARDEMALFGRAGVTLDQALIKVGEEGLGPFIKHMQDLGIFLDTETIESLKSTAESFKNLNDQIKGVATTFLAGLAPALSQAADSLVKATTQGTGGLKDLGEEAGFVLKAILLAMEVVGKAIGATVAAAVSNFQTIAEAAMDVITGQFLRAGTDLASGFKEQINIFKAFGSDVAATFKGLFPDEQAKPEGKKGPGGDAGDAAGGNTAALAKAKLSLLEAQLQNELKLYQAHAVLVKENDRQAYSDGTISLTEYYARRAALINGELDKEIATLKAKRQLVAAEKLDINDPVAKINQQKELEKINNEISVAELKRTAELIANTNEQANAQRKLYDDTLKAEERLLTIAGKKTEAARLKLALDIASLDAQLRKGGTSDADRAGAEATVAGQGGAKISFDDAAQKAQADLAALESQRKGFQNQVRDGELFSIDAAQKIVAADKAMLPALQADAAAMLALAEQTGNALDKEKAQAYKDKIDQIAASTNELGIQTAQLRQGVESAVGAGINKFLTDAVSGTKNLKQSFTDMALSMLADLEKVAIKILEEDALKSIFGASSGVAGATGGGWVGAIASLVGGHAEGGHIRGPGTSTSDSIPARLSDGEFVVQTKAVQQPGVLPLLTAINAGALKGVNGPTTVPKFAAGGQVGGSGGAPVIKMVNVLDPTTLGDHLSTDAGEHAVLNIISRHPGKVRNALG